MQCLHRNDDPMDNRPENLYWGTPKQNMADRAANGNMPVGEGHKSSKLTAQQVTEIRQRVANGETQHALARELGISQGHISDLVNRKRWSSLPAA
jgi:DNA-binding NarL/FixJ family response regulator